jgi:hypothetical protein
MVEADEKTMGRRKANDIAEQRLLIVHNCIGKVFPDHPFIRNHADGVVFKESSELRGPEQSTVVSAVIEWFVAENVSGAEQVLIQSIPHNKGKIADDMTRAIDAPAFIGPQD